MRGALLADCGLDALFVFQALPLTWARKLPHFLIQAGEFGLDGDSDGPGRPQWHRVQLGDRGAGSGSVCE